MTDNRAVRIVAAAFVATLVGIVAVGAVGFLMLTSAMFVRLPQTNYMHILFGGLALLIFSFAFAVSFREILGKLK